MYFFHFSLTLLLGIIGNLLILVAILGYKKMKSPTNVFLASLALADLLLCLICIPVKVRNLYMNNLQKMNKYQLVYLSKKTMRVDFVQNYSSRFNHCTSKRIVGRKAFFFVACTEKSDLFYVSKSCFAQSKVLCMCTANTHMQSQNKCCFLNKSPLFTLSKHFCKLRPTLVSMLGILLIK